jgi:hypothetical protein
MPDSEICLNAYAAWRDVFLHILSDRKTGEQSGVPATSG